MTMELRRAQFISFSNVYRLANARHNYVDGEVFSFWFLICNGLDDAQCLSIDLPLDFELRFNDYLIFPGAFSRRIIGWSALNSGQFTEV